MPINWTSILSLTQNYKNLPFVIENNNGTKYLEFNSIPNTGKIHIKPELINKSDDQIFKIYPNPGKDKLYVQVYTDKEDKINFMIYDIDNKLIYQKDLYINQYDNIKEFDISRFKKGTYFIIATVNNNIYKHKFLI
ncbi:MAG: T9SS type A sorting domain-containing protein [Bacteroidota bacterium]|nr:T9SS type A sorting domain-containing protein [Bacteroidota bacterium]